VASIKKKSNGSCTFDFENNLRTQGYNAIAGIDEAGRGPLAGPVVAAAVILPPVFEMPGLNDSKKLSIKMRCTLFDLLTQDPAISFGIGLATVQEIDRINILKATHLAMQRAIQALPVIPDHLLIDGLPVATLDSRQTALVNGDARSLSIAAASVIAKVTRDAMMHDCHERFPQYEFKKNKGYGTPQHLERLRVHGPCEIHRRSFEPVAQAYLPFP
jgi:ribonuclease HII